MSFLLPLAGGLLSGILNQGPQNTAANAGAQSAAAQSQLSDAQRQVINTLLAQFAQVFQPLQQQVGAQYGQMAGLPTGSTMAYTVANLLNPQAYRDVSLNEILRGMTGGMDEIRAHLGDQLDETRLTGLASQMGESAIEQTAQMNIAQNQSQDQRNMAALQALMSGLGGAGQFSGLGTALTGQGMAGLQGLGQIYGQSGAAASNALANMPNPWGGLAAALANMAQPQAQPTQNPTAVAPQIYYPQNTQQVDEGQPVWWGGGAPR